MKPPVKSLLVAVLLAARVAIAQEVPVEEKQKDNTVKAVGFSSQFLLSTDFKAVYFNMVGGQIRYVRNNFSASIAIMPTLRFRKDPHEDPDEDLRPFVTPGFSVGGLFMYKQFMLGFPISYSYDNRWHPTVGLGYKFGK